jgi:MFS superfamily sulfate permease-like transporter
MFVSVLTLALSDVVALAVVSFAIAISVARTYALKSQQKIGANQELVALGLGNLVRFILKSAPNLTSRLDLFSPVTWLALLFRDHP